MAHDKEKTKEVIEKAKYYADKSKRYKLRKRAEKVGLEPLKGGRPHPAKRKAWIKKLEKLEKAKLK